MGLAIATRVGDYSPRVLLREKDGSVIAEWESVSAKLDFVVAWVATSSEVTGRKIGWGDKEVRSYFAFIRPSIPNDSGAMDILV